MKLSRAQLENTICIACGKRFGMHTKSPASKKFNLPTLMTCMFRIQGTFIESADKAKQVKQAGRGKVTQAKPSEDETAKEIEALTSTDIGDDGEIDE